MRIHEDSPAMQPRPPRPPAMRRPLSSVETSSIHDPHHLPPSYQGPLSCRSSASNQAHFLDGFNVEGCFDVRSIPDPPTPQPRNRRRLSSPMINMRSLEDVTNQACDKPAKGQKRNRRSLCHVPAPFDEQRQEESIAIGQRSSFQPVQSSICFDDDGIDGTGVGARESNRIVNKRRKKRQSMVLPTDLVKNHVNSESTRGKGEEQGSPRRKRDFKGDFESMKQLQNLVRGYYSKPEDQREDVAQAIEDSTGYPIVIPKGILPDKNPNKKAILQKVYPVIQEMDKRKSQETKFWECETNCRVEKSRSGKYRYREIDSNLKIGSEEYKQRYMAVLERKKSEILEKSNAWKANLKLTEHDSIEQKSNTVVEDEDNMKELEDLNLASFRPGECEERSESISPLPIDSNEDDTMDLCDLSMSLDLGDAANISFDDQESGSSTNDFRSSPARSHSNTSEEKLEPKPSEGSEDMGVIQSIVSSDEQKVDGCAESSRKNSEALLPFPDRDEESMDPEIAKAERKLWDQIDCALHDYSREVLRIREMRRQNAETVRS